MLVTKNGFRTTETRSYIMTQIKSKNTIAEVKLRKAIWKLGFRYTLKNKELPGKPDIVLPRYKLAIFVDGDFWHGYKWKVRKSKLRNNRKYWIKKIEENMKRDRKIRNLLKKQGWTVIKFWEHEIKTNIESCVEYVKMKI